VNRLKVVIPSANAANLVPCVRALLDAEPTLSPADVIVVDDGARAGAAAALPGITWVAGVKPFVFARNANAGIQAAAPADVLLLNDDTRLLSYGGLQAMARALGERPDVGLCSAAIRGVVGNPRQLPADGEDVRLEPETLAFVAVFIPRRVFDRLGPLDERFIGYGWEDNDYCARARAAGWLLAVADCCIFDHSGELPSSFRTREDVAELSEINRRLYVDDRSVPHHATTSPPPPAPVPRATARAVEPVSLMFLACNRLEFTQESFKALLANTDWPLVSELHVYDDQSSDGTREWLDRRLADVPCPARLTAVAFGSPVDAMAHFIDNAGAPMLAKVDNDAMMPPGWLQQSLAVFQRHPELDLLGIEAMYPHDGRPEVPRSYMSAPFISGLGVYRAHAFRMSRPAAYQKWFGLEEWQEAHGPGELVRGWITPALEVFLLDRCPFEPWASLTEWYIARDWMRRWPKYDESCSLWQWRWPHRAGVACA
jgi:GT2 family glycosyltransferase